MVEHRRRQIFFAIRAIVVPLACVVALYAIFRSNPAKLTALALFATLLVLVIDLTTLAKGVWQNLLVSCAALLVGLCGLEAYGDATVPSTTLKAGHFRDKDEALGWINGPPGVYPVEKIVGGKTIYKATYTIDDERRRMVRSNPKGPKIAFLGDSFTFGEGLDDTGTLPQRFADLSGADVLDLGVTAYSPAQALRILQLGRADKQLAGVRLLILQTAGFHIQRVACIPVWVLSAPRYTLVDGKPTTSGPCESPERRHLLEIVETSGIYRLLGSPPLAHITRGDLDVYVAIVKEIERLARDKYHVPLLIIYHDQGLDVPGVTNDALKARFEAPDVQVVDGTVTGRPGDVLAIPGDGHPTAIANGLLARKVIDRIRATWPGLLAARAPATADHAAAN